MALRISNQMRKKSFLLLIELDCTSLDLSSWRRTAGAAWGAKNGSSKCGSTFPELLPLIVYALVKDYMDRVGRVQFVEEVEVPVEKKRVSALHA